MGYNNGYDPLTTYPAPSRTVPSRCQADLPGSPASMLGLLAALPTPACYPLLRYRLGFLADICGFLVAQATRFRKHSSGCINFLRVLSPFQGSFFLESRQKPRENGLPAFWKERWLKRIEMEPTPRNSAVHPCDSMYFLARTQERRSEVRIHKSLASHTSSKANPNQSSRGVTRATLRQ